MKFRKKPIVIEAIQWMGDNWLAVKAFAGEDAVRLAPRSSVLRIGPPESLEIVTPEGLMSAAIGDWIIRGIKGEFYPCKLDIFEATYEAVDE